MANLIENKKTYTETNLKIVSVSFNVYVKIKSRNNKTRIYYFLSRKYV